MIGIGEINNAIAEIDTAVQENARAINDMSNLAIETSSMANSLILTANKTKFDKESMNWICDIDMMFELNKLKLDHINFKENAFKNLNTFEKIKVVNEHNCNLGKWIDKHSMTEFAKSKEWTEFNFHHHQVHSLVQQYIDANNQHLPIDELEKISIGIEENIEKVFEFANKIKAVNCRDKNGFKRQGKLDTRKTDQQVNRRKDKKITTSNFIDNDWESF